MAATPPAIIYPAFISSYAEDTSGRIVGFKQVFGDLLHTASRIDSHLDQFSFSDNPMTGDELRNQCITYIYGCSVSRILRHSGIRPGLCSGYSMGIYASLEACGSVSFLTGLHLVREAFIASAAVKAERPYGMGIVIGLTRQDIMQFPEVARGEVEIVNQNSPVSFVVSGPAAAVEEILLQSKSEGALHIRRLDVTLPFHTRYMESAAVKFSRCIEQLDITDPVIPLISMVSGRLTGSRTEILQELHDNLCRPFSWYHTQQRIVQMGFDTLTEAGPEGALRRNARFTENGPAFPLWTSLIQPS